LLATLTHTVPRAEYEQNGNECDRCDRPPNRNVSERWMQRFARLYPSILGASFRRIAMLLARKLFIFVTGKFFFAEQAINDRDKKQRRDGGHEQTANHGAPEGCILLAALAQT